jgi:hypothetical protein
MRKEASYIMGPKETIAFSSHLRFFFGSVRKKIRSFARHEDDCGLTGGIIRSCSSSKLAKLGAGH